MTTPRRLATALALLFCLASASAAQALPGQVIRDPEHPQWLMRAGGEHLFLAGPGDPEGFFFRGTRLPDGTRDGDQDELIDALIEHGGNSIYIEAVRSHGGDGPSDHNPFIDSNPSLGIDEDILDQWEAWLTRFDDADIMVLFFVYDDGSRIWNTGSAVGPEEDAFLRALVNRFEHHRNIAFLAYEESEEAVNSERARAIAATLADADDHGHLIGNHHHSGTTFKVWQDGSALDLFAMHYNKTGDEIHHGAVTTFNTGSTAGAADHGYMTLYTECLVTKTGNTEVRRHFMWDSAMGGVQPMVYGMDIHDTPVVQLQQCRVLQEFMESTDFWRMVPSDARARGATKWVLAAPAASGEVSAIAYTREVSGDLGLGDMQAGTVDLLWIDAVNGTRVKQRRVVVTDGDNFFARPPELGNELALWISRSWDDLGHALAGSGDAPRLRADGTLIGGELVTLHASGSLPNAPGLFIIGLSGFFGPLKGGVLVPAPDFLVNVSANAQGERVISAPWPMGAPADLPVYLQIWFADPGAPANFVATNAVLESTP
ncbi:MAG: hypothetical protein DHS20C15_15780 [Planctomycetota bacterium]|nr:MAG: hypothetical protein DHS20C15_15780 [Planctomycetota bacterium]